MAQSEENPFAYDPDRQEPHNPYAAPASMGDVATESGPPLADRLARFAGAFVDGLTMIPGIAIIFYLSFISGAERWFVEDSLVAGFMLDIAGAIIAAAMYLLINGYLLAKRGQTVGKLVVGTRIVDSETNQIIPLGRLFIKRFCTSSCSGSFRLSEGSLYLPMCYLIFRENRRCLHDDFAGTKVIKV
ncbi:MAG: RDD family protein [Planctomycetaceae bacterium]